MPERQLTIQQKRYLKFAHLFFAALWGGGATTFVLLFCLFHPSTAHEQITFSKILFYIDFIIVGPGAGGCLATGLIYSLYGNWGFFKFRWITLKYVINILFITYGMLVFLPFTHSQYSYYLSQPTEAIIPEESIWMNIFCTSQNFCTRTRPVTQTEPRLRCIAPPYPPTGLCGYGLPRTPVPMPPGTGNAPPSSPVTSCPSSSWGRPQNTNSTGWTKPPAHHINEKPRRTFSCRGFWRHASNLKVFPCPLYGSPLDVGLKPSSRGPRGTRPRKDGDQGPVSLRSRRPVSWPASWRRA